MLWVELESVLTAEKTKLLVNAFINSQFNYTPLTHFMPLISFDIPCKHQKTSGFLMFSGGIKRDQLHEMG